MNRSGGIGEHCLRRHSDAPHIIGLRNSIGLSTAARPHNSHQ